MGKPSWALFVALIGTVLIGERQVCAQHIDEQKARKVKAAYLYNFAKFIQFPETAFVREGAPFVIGVVGDSPLAETLDRTVQGKTIKNRPIEVIRVDPRASELANSIGACHLLFVSEMETTHLPEILRVTSGKPVLTVSSISDFAQRGGMIGLVLDEGRIIFEINRSALVRAKLLPSSRLLGLARHVSSDERSAKEEAPVGRGPVPQRSEGPK